MKLKSMINIHFLYLIYISSDNIAFRFSFAVGVNSSSILLPYAHFCGFQQLQMAAHLDYDMSILYR